MKHTGQTYARYFGALVPCGKRSSSQRDHPAMIPRIARDVWLNSISNSPLTFPSACECVSNIMPPKMHTAGNTSVVAVDFQRFVSACQVKIANTVISNTAARCCKTSGTAKLSQNPLGPSGQFSGSALKNKNTASPRNISGQILAHEK